MSSEVQLKAEVIYSRWKDSFISSGGSSATDSQVRITICFCLCVCGEAGGGDRGVGGWRDVPVSLSKLISKYGV